MDNAIGGAFMDCTFNEATELLDRLTKISRPWHTRDSQVASNTYSSGMTVEQHRREEKQNQDMSHLKTQMDFLTKYLISGKVEKVKYVG